MNIEELITRCEACVKQIRQYDPEPYYVGYFFAEYLTLVNNIVVGIFEEADRDFGLFVSEISEQGFYKKAKAKDDKKAIEFSEWYSITYAKEHQSLYPNFVSQIRHYQNKFGRLSEIKIMIRALDGYEGDMKQQLGINLRHGKLRSRDELYVEIKRQLPVFLQVINQKRDKKAEPKITKEQIVASACLGVEDHEDIEIARAAEVYIPVLKRLVEESRKMIGQLTRV